MRCKDALREMSVTPLEETPPWKAWRVRRHLRGCPECAREIAAIHRLEDEARHWRADAPPTRLQERIAAAIAWESQESRPEELVPQTTGRMSNVHRQPQKGQTMLLKLSLAGAAIAAGAVFFSVHGKPAVAEAEIIRRMTSVSQAVRTAHVTWWMTDYKTDNDTVEHHGSLDRVEENWYQNGRTRKEGVWGSRLIVGATEAVTDAQGKKSLKTPGTYYRYDPHAGKVTAIPEVGLQYSRFTLEEFVGDLTQRAPSSLETLGFMRLGDRLAREISISVSRSTSDVNHNPVLGDSRQLCWVDAETDLPIRIDDERYESGVWRTTGRVDFEFNQNLSPALFDPSTLKKE